MYCCVHLKNWPRRKEMERKRKRDEQEEQPRTKEERQKPKETKRERTRRESRDEKESSNTNRKLTLRKTNATKTNKPAKEHISKRCSSDTISRDWDTAPFLTAGTGPGRSQRHEACTGNTWTFFDLLHHARNAPTKEGTKAHALWPSGQAGAESSRSLSLSFSRRGTERDSKLITTSKTLLTDMVLELNS